jgi:hypothetical protein
VRVESWGGQSDTPKCVLSESPRELAVGNRVTEGDPPGRRHPDRDVIARLRDPTVGTRWSAKPFAQLDLPTVTRSATADGQPSGPEVADCGLVFDGGVSQREPVTIPDYLRLLQDYLPGDSEAVAGKWAVSRRPG